MTKNDNIIQYMSLKNIGDEFETTKLSKELVKIYRGSEYRITDYCYNHYANGSRWDDSKPILLFEYISWGKVRYLGLDYPYNGNVLDDDGNLFAKWENGKYTINSDYINNIWNKKKFEKWLQTKKYADKSIAKYCSALNKVSEHFKDLKLRDSLFDYSSFRDLEETIAKILQHKDYQEVRKNKIDCLQKALEHTCTYLNIQSLNFDTTDEKLEEYEEHSMTAKPKNQILYGPPGTGKTYNTVVETMRIMKPKLIQYYEHNLKDENKDNQKRSDDGKIINYEFLKDKFDILKQQGRIEFVTFHQSYSYEEFVEGIKPVLNADSIKYDKKEGIFKIISNSALFDMLDISNDDKESAFTFNNLVEKFKSLYPIGSIIKTEKSSFVIADYLDSSIRVSPSNSNEKYSISFEPLEDMFNINLKEPYSMPKDLADRYGSYKGLSTYYFNILSEFKKIYDDIDNNIQIEKSITNNFSREQKKEFIKKYLKKEISLKTNYEPYVLIIDEINRGNISKIFGELITLLEEDKRVGEKNEVTVRLPYSEPDEPAFGVPSNLYIIGTMNTSDRSIASVDIALRRRFKFKEMMPDSSLVPEKIGNLELRKIFKDLNTRIKILLDRDHQIGHSYFIGIDSIKKLKEVWFSSIMPLLNEYFYGDWDKLNLVIPEFIIPQTIPSELRELCDDNFYEFKTLENFKDNLGNFKDDLFIEALNEIKIPEKNEKNSTT